MSDQKLSENFNLSEFTYSKAADRRIKPTEFQIGMLKRLCEDLLQPIRDAFGSLRITSGLRDRVIYDALVKAGLPASKTSDHFLVPYLTKVGNEWMAPTFAPNPRGKGAADFVPLNADAWIVYYWIIKRFKPKFDFNQVIIYPKDYSKANSDYIHIANPARLFIAKAIIPSKQPILVYVAGNKKFNKDFVSLDEFKKSMGNKFKERR